MKDEHEEACLGETDGEYRQSRGGNKPSLRPGMSSCSQALHLPPALPILPWLQHLSPSWLLHLGLEDLQQVVLPCFLALLILLIMKNSQEFIILL